MTDNTLFIARVTSVMMPVMMFILNVLSVVIIWVGARQVADANMQVGDVMAFLQYAMQIVFSFLMLSMLFIILPRAQVSADRIADVLEIEPIIHDPVNPQPLNGRFTGTVEFRNVSFRYPGPIQTSYTTSVLWPGPVRPPRLSARRAQVNPPW